jgi:Domain of unknown function (DUF397)
MPDQTSGHLAWRKSRASGENSECVEVAFAGPSVFIRDSSNRAGVTLEVSSATWRDLIERIQDGGLTG